MNTRKEHVLVFTGPEGSLTAVWPQSTREGQSNQRTVFARENGDRTWTRHVQNADRPADAGPKTHAGMASWEFAMVSP